MCEGPRPLGRSPRFPGGARWRALLQPHRLPAALAVADLERHLLALLHVVPAGALQHGGVEEHVLAAVVRGDEAEAAHLVEPLHRAADVVGRAAGVAAEVAPRRPIAEGARRSVAETSPTTAPEAAAPEAAAAAAEVAPRGPVAEAAAPEVAPGWPVAEAAAAAEVAPRGPVAEVAPRRAVAEAATAAAALAALQLRDA